MRRQGIGAQIIMVIVAIFFVVNGIPVLLDGQYFFALVWFLLTGLFLVQAIRQLFSTLQQCHKERADFEEDDVIDESGHMESDIKKRLLKLDDLYRSQLITKEEYEQKRKEILQKL